MKVHNSSWETFPVFRLVPVVINLSLKRKKTHSKLIVGVHGSFPHRSGIVKTLHVVGLVEAARLKK